MDVGVGVVGCGRIAQMFHLPALQRADGARLVAIADLDPGSLKRARAVAPEATPLADYRDLVNVPGVEAVVVCLPSNLHAAAAVAALEAGKHVYVEKPLATSLDDASDIVEAAQRSGSIGMVGFNFRFHPVYRQARRLLGAGGLGAPIAAQSVVSSAPRSLPEWKRTRVTGGGALLDLASHHVDLVRSLFDAEVTSVAASIRSVRTEDDTVALSLDLDRSLTVQTLASMATMAEDRFDVYTPAGRLVVDRYRRRKVSVVPAHGLERRAVRWATTVREAVRVPLALRDTFAPPPEPSFAAALQAFVASCRSGQQVGPTVLDGYASLAVIEAAEKSAREGRAMPVAAQPASGIPGVPSAASG